MKRLKIANRMQFFRDLTRLLKDRTKFISRIIQELDSKVLNNRENITRQLVKDFVANKYQFSGGFVGAQGILLNLSAALFEQIDKKQHIHSSDITAFGQNLQNKLKDSVEIINQLFNLNTSDEFDAATIILTAERLKRELEEIISTCDSLATIFERERVEEERRVNVEKNKRREENMLRVNPLPAKPPLGLPTKKD